jgi:hypothetical protein
MADFKVATDFLLAPLMIGMWLCALEMARDQKITGSVDLGVRALAVLAPILGVGLFVNALGKVTPHTPTWHAIAFALAVLVHMLAYAWLRHWRETHPTAYEICLRSYCELGQPQWEVWKEYTNLTPEAARSAMHECRRTWPEYWFYLQRVGETRG